MPVVNIHQAKSQLSRLLEQAQHGEDVVIAKAGRPIARLVPYTGPKGRILPPGAMEGEAWMADDFDAPVDVLFDCLDGAS